MAIYEQLGSFIVTETGMPGSGSLRVGFGNTIPEAIDNVISTPFGAHEDEEDAVRWAYLQGEDRFPEEGFDATEELSAEVIATELRGESITEELLDWLQRFAQDILVRDADADHDSAEQLYNDFGWTIEIGRHELTHPYIEFTTVDETRVSECMTELFDAEDFLDEDDREDALAAVTKVLEIGRVVRDYAIDVEKNLKAAAAAYKRRAAGELVLALKEAYDHELDVNGCPQATLELAEKVLTPFGIWILKDM